MNFNKHINKKYKIETNGKLCGNCNGLLTHNINFGDGWGWCLIYDNIELSNAPSWQYYRCDECLKEFGE